MKKISFVLVLAFVLVSSLTVFANNHEHSNKPAAGAEIQMCCDFEKGTCAHNADGKVCCDFEKKTCAHNSADKMCCDFEKKTCAHNKASASCCGK